MADKTVIVEIQYDTEAAIKSLNELTASVEGEKVAQAKLKAELESGTLSQKEYSIEVEKSKQKAAAANAERKTTLQLISSEKGSINELKANIKLLTAERDKLNQNTVAGRKAASEYTAKINTMKASLKEAQTETKKTGGAFAKLGDNLKGIPGPIGGMINGFMGMTKAAMAFIATPLGAVIAAIVVAVTALVNIFKKFDPVIDAIEQGLAALGAVFTNLKETVIAVITGQKSLKEAITGVGASMKEAAKEAINLKKAEQELDDMTLKNIASSAKYKRQIDELLLQSKDRTKSEKERSKLIDEALKIEEQAYAERKAIADREYEIALGKIEIGRNLTDEQKKALREQGVAAAIALKDTKAVTDEEVKAFAEAIANRENILDESISIREKAINRQNAIEEKAAEAAQKRAEKERENRKNIEAALQELRKETAEMVDQVSRDQLETETDITNQLIELHQKEVDDFEAGENAMMQKRGEAIAKLAELKQQELIDGAKTFEARMEAQKEQADVELQWQLENTALTNEEKELAEYEHKIRLQEIEAEYQANIKQQRETALQEAYDSLNGIIEATKGMADMRVTILSDAFSKIATINFKEEGAAKKTYTAIGQAATQLTSAIVKNYDNEYAELATQKAAELALVGDNKEAQDVINKQYAEKENQLKKKQFEDNKKKAIIDGAIATALAVLNGLTTQPFFPLGIAMAALAAVLGGIQIASIAKQNYTPSATFAKGGIIGGKSHADGGTQFWGSDGSRFEAEKGEAMFVMKKDATAEIAALSAINESHGGRSFFERSHAGHFAEGGEVTKQASDIRKTINDEIDRRPIVVRVSDIQTGMTDVENSKSVGVV